MAKDVNIHIKTPGAAESRRKIDASSDSVKKLGDTTDRAGKKGAAGMDELGRKSTAAGDQLSSLEKKFFQLAGAYVSLNQIIKFFDDWLARLDAIHQAQEKIYRSTLDLMEVGQRLEYQTGTIGQQLSWAQQAVSLQQAGALAAPGVAEQMMVSADIAFAAQGGIKNPAVMAMLTQIAPMVGAAQLGGAEVAQMFDLAGTAGIAPTPAAYQLYIAQLHAAYTASKATDFGAFITGFQKGATPFMAAGGTLTGGLGLFAGARAVIGSEMLAGTALEQMTRLSAGAYERPRRAMERAMGVRWSDIQMDERMNILMQYALTFPESQRVQKLVEQGFPPELAQTVSKMVSPEATAKMAEARRAVSAATVEKEQAQTAAYLESDLAQQRISDARVEAEKLKVAPRLADWQRSYKEAKEIYETRLAAGEDLRWLPEKHEPTYYALQMLIEEMDRIMPQMPEADRARAAALRGRIDRSVRQMESPFMGITSWMFRLPESFSIGMGREYYQQWNDIVNPAPTVIHNVHYGDNYNPRQGTHEGYPFDPNSPRVP